MSNKNPEQIDQNWDEYWSRSSKKQSHWAYDQIAIFYRKYIIRPSLTGFIKKYFRAGDKVLHAGCGSGQVDGGISDYIDITALDLSAEALQLYQKFNPQVKNLIHGSIFDIPKTAESFDGIYNLGVMEHFDRQDIHQILLEFYRVLKPGGKIVLFWPPKLGLSVNFLKVVHFILNDVLKKNISLHPAEIVHIRSPQDARQILQNAGFSLLEYSFGPSDAFTHAIVVGQKIDSAF